LVRGNKLVGWGDTPSAAKRKARISNYELMMGKLQKTARHNTYKRAGRRSKVARHSPRR